MVKDRGNGRDQFARLAIPRRMEAAFASGRRSQWPPGRRPRWGRGRPAACNISESGMPN